MRPQWGWWLEPVPQGHTSCWSTTSDAGRTAPTQLVGNTVLVCDTRHTKRKDINPVSSSFPLLLSSLPAFRWRVCFRREGASSRHSAGLPPPPHAPANPTRAQSSSTGWGQANPGAGGRPPVAAGLSADSAAPQRGHHHRRFLNTHNKQGFSVVLLSHTHTHRDINQASPPPTCNFIIVSFLEI